MVSRMLRYSILYSDTKIILKAAHKMIHAIIISFIILIICEISKGNSLAEVLCHDSTLTILDREFAVKIPTYGVALFIISILYIILYTSIIDKNLVMLDTIVTVYKSGNILNTGIEIENNMLKGKMLYAHNKDKKYIFLLEYDANNKCVHLYNIKDGNVFNFPIKTTYDISIFVHILKDYNLTVYTIENDK